MKKKGSAIFYRAFYAYKIAFSAAVLINGINHKLYASRAKYVFAP